MVHQVQIAEADNGILVTVYGGGIGAHQTFSRIYPKPWQHGHQALPTQSEQNSWLRKCLNDAVSAAQEAT